MIRKDLTQRILVLDGAMGTMIQQHGLEEEDYRGHQFQNSLFALKGNNDLLSLTQPSLIEDIHRAYLLAGADIIETNTFNANAISQSDYGLEDLVTPLNVHSAKLAKTLTTAFSTPEKPRYTAGSIGPTNKTLSISPKAEDPAFRALSFDELVAAYEEQVSGLIDGGVDLLLVETIFDTLNAKACLWAIENIFVQKQVRLPIMLSGTITDASGRTLSGQTLEAFLISLAHPDLLSVGLNCALGAQALTPYLKVLSKESKLFTSVHPNAGLPNAFGQYDETPEEMLEDLSFFLDNQWVNIVGGCCGTTPDHIALIAQKASRSEPRKL